MLSPIRHAVHSLLRSPAFAVPATLTLALAMTAVATIFSVGYAVMLRPLPYPQSDRLYVLTANQGFDQTGQTFHYVRDHAQSFERIAADGGTTGWNLVREGAAEHVAGAFVSEGYFETLGVRPLIGRTFNRVEDAAGPGAPKVVVLSEPLWRRLFDARPDVIGQTVQLGGVTRVIVGVMPASFWQAQAADVWTPLRLSPNDNGQNYAVIGRLQPVASAVQASAELDAMRSDLRQQFHLSEERAQSLRWQPYQAWLGYASHDQLVALNGAVAVLLLIACVNVGSLQLVRGMAKQREMATRAALGASRRRLVVDMLTESVLLAIAGGAIGLLAARWCVAAFISIIPHEMLGNYVVSIDVRVIIAILGVTTVSAITFGLAPAVALSGFNLRAALIENGQQTSTRRGVRLRRLFARVQVALAVVLLFGAALFLRSFEKLQSVSLGFDRSSVLVGQMTLQGSPDQIQGGYAPFIERTLAEIEAIPGVSAAAVGSSIPVERGINIAIRPPAGSPIDQTRSVDWRFVTPGYFDVFRIPLKAGRAFDARDGKATLPVAVVNESFARIFFGHPNVVGELMPFGRNRFLKIVGIAGDVKNRSGAGWTSGLNALAAQPPPAFYVPTSQLADDEIALPSRWFPLNWIVRTDARASNVEGAMREIMRRNAPQLPFVTFETMDDVIASDLQEQRVLMVLFGVFALSAVALVAVGIYGLAAYAVRLRAQEVGIRIALGAESGDIIRGFLSDGARVLLTGMAGGFIAAPFAGRWLEPMIYGVTPRDATTYILVFSVLGAIGLAAIVLPSLQVARLNPANIIRTE